MSTWIRGGVLAVVAVGWLGYLAVTLVVQHERPDPSIVAVLPITVAAVARFPVRNARPAGNDEDDA